MQLPDTYSCRSQPWDVSGAAALLATVLFILYSGNYKRGLKSVSLSRNPPFSTFHLFFPSLRHNSEPSRSLALQQVSREGGRGAGETPDLRGRGKPRGSQHGQAARRTYSASAPGRAGWLAGGLAARRRAAGGTGCGAPGQPGYKGRARRRRPGCAGRPVAGKLRLRLPSESGLKPKGREKSPPTGKKSPRRENGWPRWRWRLPRVGPCREAEPQRRVLMDR